MSRPYSIQTGISPRWYQFRWKLSNALVKLAKFIHPPNPEVWAFFVECAMDEMIYGKSVMQSQSHDHAEPGAWLDARTREKCE